MLQNSTTGFQVLLSTLNSGYEASLQCDKLLLGAGAAVAQQEVRSSGQGYQVVPVTHKTVCHNKRGIIKDPPFGGYARTRFRPRQCLGVNEVSSLAESAGLRGSVIVSHMTNSTPR